MKPNSEQIIRLGKVLVFLGSLLPVGLLYVQYQRHALGANPFEVITRALGEYGLFFILLSLCMTPLREALAQSWPIRFRRMLGLYGFFYVCLHWTSYLWLDQFFDWYEIGLDILKRPFITVGMLAFILLIPLAVTSTRGMQRRLGRHWKKLHQAVYLIILLGGLHFFMLVKADLARPMTIGAIILLLLGYRLWRKQVQRRSKNLRM